MSRLKFVFSDFTYGEMEDSLGAILLHIVPIQGDVLDPAALGEQQVCSRRQGADVRARGGANGRRHATMVNTYRGKRAQLGLVRGYKLKPQFIEHVWILF